MRQCLDGLRDLHVLEPKCIVHIAPNNSICFDYFLYFMIDEKVKRINMLFDETLNFKKRWH